MNADLNGLDWTKLENDGRLRVVLGFISFFMSPTRSVGYYYYSNGFHVLSWSFTFEFVYHLTRWATGGAPKDELAGLVS